MADDDEERRSNKRKLTPEAKQNKDKVFIPYESINPHPSIVNLHSSPVNTHPLNIAKKCEIAGISEAQSQIDPESLYKLICELTTRVTSLESQVEKKDEELFNLRRDHASLHQQLDELRKDRQTPTTDDSNFLDVVKEELPKLSDNVAEHESELVKLKQDVTDLKAVRDEEMNNEENGGTLEIKKELQTLIDARKGDQKLIVSESRKHHLDGDQRDQYSMKDTIRVTGVPYKRDEDTNDLIRRIACSVGVTVNKDDISVSHRTGKRRANTPRAIICRFTRRDVKHQIIRNKKLAKNISHDDDGNPVKIFIDEKLTPMRANVCRYLRSQKIDHHTWDGKIFIPNADRENQTEAQWKVLDRGEDWINWEVSEKTKTDLGIFPKL